MEAAPLAGSMLVMASAPAASLQGEERQVPAPGPGEVLLRLRVAGLCGTDLWKLAQGVSRAGTVLGHEVVGEIVAMGGAIDGYALGDRVVAPHHVACGDCARCHAGNETLCPAFFENQLQPGGFSEYLVVGERVVRRALFGLPATLTDEAAVFLEPAACVLRGLDRAGLPTAGGVAILGAGSMGLLHLLLLKATRPSLAVVVCEPRSERAAMARELGADAVADHPEAAARALANLGGSDGAVAVFDTAGGLEALRAAFALGAPASTTVLFAHAPAGGDASFELNHFFKEERRLIGTYSSGRSEQRQAFRLLTSGRLDPRSLVTHRLPLARAQEGLELARSGRALKVLLLGAEAAA